MNLSTLSAVLPKKMLFMSFDFPWLPMIIISASISAAFLLISTQGVPSQTTFSTLRFSSPSLRTNSLSFDFASTNSFFLFRLFHQNGHECSAPRNHGRLREKRRPFLPTVQINLSLF